MLFLCQLLQAQVLLAVHDRLYIADARPVGCEHFFIKFSVETITSLDQAAIILDIFFYDLLTSLLFSYLALAE